MMTLLAMMVRDLGDWMIIAALLAAQLDHKWQHIIITISSYHLSVFKVTIPDDEDEDTPATLADDWGLGWLGGSSCSADKGVLRWSIKGGVVVGLKMVAQME